MSELLPGGRESNGRDLAPWSAPPVWLADRMSQRVAISGASGFIGSALSSYLVARGDDVRHLVRREARTGSEISWDPAQRRLDAEAFEDVDAVVHLAGAGVGDRRWSPGYKQEILASRTDGTSTVASAVAAHGDRIRLVSASAVGWYGSDRGDEILTEQSPEGTGFLAEVAQAWEASTAAASAVGAPVAMSRTGLVMSRKGGAFEPLVRLGPGRCARVRSAVVAVDQPRRRHPRLGLPRRPSRRPGTGQRRRAGTVAPEADRRRDRAAAGPAHGPSGTRVRAPGGARGVRR